MLNFFQFDLLYLMLFENILQVNFLIGIFHLSSNCLNWYFIKTNQLGYPALLGISIVSSVSLFLCLYAYPLSPLSFYFSHLSLYLSLSLLPLHLSLSILEIPWFRSDSQLQIQVWQLHIYIVDQLLCLALLRIFGMTIT